MGRREREPESVLPLRDLELWVLLSVEEEPLHGYALLGRVAERSGGFLKPGPASLYRTLSELTSSGMLEEAAGHVDPESQDERRRYFRATTFGRAVLRAELRRLSALLAQARASGIRYEGGAR
jgi:DNA-binding PadR family transcriptional regulator